MPIRHWVCITLLLDEVAAMNERSLHHRLIVVLFCVIIFSILCTLGFNSVAMPVETIAIIWPGAILHSVGAILFGFWGIIATITVGLIVNGIITHNLYITLAFILPNFIQSFIPAWSYRQIINKYGWSERTFDFFPFLLFGALLPNMVGAVFGTLLLQLDVARNLPYSFSFLRWLIANVPITLLLGYPLFRCLGPIMAEEGMAVKGWWK